MSGNTMRWFFQPPNNSRFLIGIVRLINELASTVPGDAPPELSKRWEAEIKRRYAEIDVRIISRLLRDELNVLPPRKRLQDLCPACGHHFENESRDFFGAMTCQHCNLQLLFRWNWHDGSRTYIRSICEKCGGSEIAWIVWATSEGTIEHHLKLAKSGGARLLVVEKFKPKNYLPAVCF